MTAMFTLEEAECLAGCDIAPCVQVNHRFFGPLDDEGFDRLVEELRVGRARRRPCRATACSAGSSAASACAGRRGDGAGDHRRRPDRHVAASSYDDSHTLERYLATGGYDGLRKALSMTPDEVAEEVNKASLLGRGGAGFPAGRKWSMLRKAPTTLPRHQRRRERAGDVQGPPAHRARPAPDHRGHDHRGLRDRRGAGVHLLPRRVRARLRAAAARPATRPTRTARSAHDIFGSDFSLDLVIHPGAGAYICGEETALLESLEGKRGFPRIKPPYFPAAIGLYGEPTVVNNVETMSNLPWIVDTRRRGVRRARRGLLDRDPAVRALGSGRAARVVRARDVEDDLPRPHLRPEPRRRDRGRQGAEGVHPRRRLGAVVRPGRTSTSASTRTRSARPARCSAPARSSSWTRRPASVRAAWRITQFFHRESCGQCTPCREGSELAREDPAPDRAGATAARRISICCSTPATTSRPALAWPPQQTTICVLGPSIPSSIASAIEDVPRRVPRPHQGGRLSRSGRR